MHRDVLLVKLGGSLITDKHRSETPRLDVLGRLAQELARAWGEMSEHLILGHGSGSFGHTAAASHPLEGGVRTPEQIEAVSVIQNQAAKLHRLVIQTLRDAGVAPFSVAPSSAMVAADGRPVRFVLQPLLRAVDLGLVPVTYGDVVVDRQRGACICSTETVLQDLALRLRRHGLAVRRILWVGETDGIYDEEGRTIPRVDRDNVEKVLCSVGGSAGIDVTGGMLHKVQTAWELSRLGIPSWILDGREPGLLEQALLDRADSGTVIASDETGGQVGSLDPRHR